MGRKEFISYKEFVALREQSPTYEDFLRNFKIWAIQRYEKDHGHAPSELAVLFLTTEIENVESLRVLYGKGGRLGMGP